MKNFKIIFPGGYTVEDFFNDNIDLNILIEDNKVYAATAFTLANIRSLMERNADQYFWLSDMFIVDNLRFETLSNAVGAILEEGYADLIFKPIGTIYEVYEKDTYEEMEGFQE